MWRWALVVACCAVVAMASVITIRAISQQDVCGVVNRNAIALRRMIINQAIASQRYGTIRLGGQVSTYADRLQNARNQARQIGGCP